MSNAKTLKNIIFAISFFPGIVVYCLYFITGLLKWHAIDIAEYILDVQNVVVAFDTASLALIISLLTCFISLKENRKVNLFNHRFFNVYVSNIKYGVMHTFLSLTSCAVVLIGLRNIWTVAFAVIEFVNAVSVNLAVVLIVLNLMMKDED